MRIHVKRLNEKTKLLSLCEVAWIISKAIQRFVVRFGAGPGATRALRSGLARSFQQPSACSHSARFPNPVAVMPAHWTWPRTVLSENMLKPA
jgi:hypothetical protein